MESIEEHRHIMGYGQLAVILALLLALTGVTVAVSYIHLGFFNVPLALTIASLKAALVLLFSCISALRARLSGTHSSRPSCSWRS